MVTSAGGPICPSSRAGSSRKRGNTVTSLRELGEIMWGGLPARENQWHRKGAATAKKEVRVGGSGSLRHGRYQLALGRGDACHHHLARLGEATTHLEGAVEREAGSTT